MATPDRASENFEARIPTGLSALEDGARIGAPIHYIDAALGEGMIRHFPDGTRQRLVRIDGILTVAETVASGVTVEAR